MPSAKEKISFLKIPELGNLELLHARFCSHQFSPHFHEGHVIGAIEKGQLGFDYRGEKLVASEGQINLADPGEVHNGFAVSEAGWQYRMFYLSPGQLEALLGEDRGKNTPMPFFKKGVLKDKPLATAILNLHRDFQDPGISFLEKESRFYDLITHVVQRHAPDPPGLPEPGKEKKRVAGITSYIQENYNTAITLDKLSQISRMSKYYLLRVFSAHTGLTPHAYLSYVRAARSG